MSFRKSRINPQTHEKETGTVMEIVQSNEPIINLELEDGTRVRIKQSILEVMRMDERNERGEEVYSIEANVSTNIIPAEEQEND